MSPNMEVDKERLVADIQDGVFVCTKAGEMVSANPAFARTLGYSREQVMSKHMARDLVDRELEWKALVSLLDQGSPIVDYEVRFKRVDGTKLCISLSATQFKDDRGMPIGIAAVARDISTRKGVENDLRDKAFRTDILNKIAKITGANVDIRHALMPICEELRKLINFDALTLGLTEEKGRHVELVAPDRSKPDLAKVLGRVPFEGSLVEKLKLGGGALIIEKDAGRRLFSEFGLLETERISSMIAVPLTSRGRILGSLNVGHSKPGEYNWESAETVQMIADQVAGLVDSTTLLQAFENKVKLYETLRRSGVEIQKAISTAQIYGTIANNIREVVPYKDISFYIVDWQKALIFPVFAEGEYTDEVMDAPGGLDEGIVGVVAKTGRAEFVDDVDADPRGAVVPGTPQDHYSMLAIPLTGSDGVLGILELYRERGHVFSVADLEAGLLFAQQASVALANAQLVAKLQDAKKEIEMLNDLMFHDINNYNFATLNYIEMIAKSPGVSDAHKAYLDKSLHLIRLNAKLIENVKKLTKIGGMKSEEFTQVDLADVLRKVAAGVQNATPDKTVSISLKVPESGAHVMGNTLIDELFVNLFNNAVKYDPHPEVEIDVDMVRVLEDTKVCWKICVADHGMGIPDDKKAKLFQKYVRLKPDSKIAGTGLGLSVCKALADKFGGRIWVEDRVPGQSDQGAKFCVVFQAAKRNEDAKT